MKDILPADTYTVINKSVITDYDKKILNQIYLPLIGPTSIMLYHCLLADLDKLELISKEHTHHHLLTNMHLSINEIVNARKKLEAIGLLKTFYKEGNINNYIYELYSPLSANEIFNHPILNVVLYNNIGKTEYNDLISYFKTPKITTTTYEEITSPFNEVFGSIPLTSYEVINDNIRKYNKLKLNINSNFDFDFLISSLPKNMLSDKQLSKENQELILNLAFIYELDVMKMASILKCCITEKGTINKELLRKTARNYYQFDHGNLLPSLIDKTQPEYLRKPIGDNSNRSKIIYDFETISPKDVLKSRNNDLEPSKRDIKLIEDLIIDFKLKPGVVNVLIDYTLKVNNKKLNRNFVESIAGQWQRLNIETVDEAMTLAEKEHKKYKKNQKVKNNNIEQIKVPDWFDKEIEKEKLSQEEQESLKDLLKEYK